MQKITKTSPSSSLTSSLYAPHFAGGIQQVEGFGVVTKFGRMKLRTTWIRTWKRIGIPLMKENLLSFPPEQLEQVEVEAGFEEVTRLITMGVLREPTPEECQNGQVLTTRSVYDWPSPRRQMEETLSFGSQGI